MNQKPRYAVVGAGHGGKAMAADLAVRGFRVHLYNRTFARVETIQIRGGIDLETEDSTHRFGPIEVVAADMGEVLDGVDVVMVVVPATAHRDIATSCAPHLRDGQIVVLHPGRTCGAMEFRHVLREQGCRAQVMVAEAQTLLFASRSMGPAEAKIFRTKNTVPVAALPATDTSPVLAALRPAYPQFIPARNVLHTSLDNMGAVFHPALTILNSARIESTHGNFEFYIEGVTPTVARILEVVDRERVTVAAALGIRAQTAQEWLETAYAAVGVDLYEAIQANPGYKGIKGPRVLAHRYLFEDVPMSLVPIAALGTRFGVSTQAIDSVIRMASILHRTDYFLRGRTLEKLGLEQLSVHEITRYVEEGTWKPNS
ncbi:MAG: NAD/NADP octopine/nopaline dehydrogenase family protein [Chloroflexi bacterium]|nr:NAD/NADP octopine/nopaline dehydrogenase family protein [Chloroflexota bacterium]